MKILRFTGHYLGGILDVRVTTDLIHASANNFTAMQIQVGTDYSPNDIQNDTYQGAMGATIKQIPSNIQAYYAFAVANNYNLSISDPDGSNKTILYDADESGSASI